MNHTPVYPALALRARDAARTLGISPRLLWSLTAPRGPIPAARIGDGSRRTILYRVADLDAWLASQSRTTEGKS